MTTPTHKQSETLKECREAFERWCREHCTEPKREHNISVDYYTDNKVQAAWNAWQCAWNTRAQPSETPVDDKVREALLHAYENISTGGMVDMLKLKEALALLDQQAATCTEKPENVCKVLERAQEKWKNDLAAKVEGLRNQCKKDRPIACGASIDAALGAVLALIGKAE